MATPYMAGREKTEEFEKTQELRIDPQNLERKRRGELANFMELHMESENVGLAKPGTKPVKFMTHKIMVPMKIAMFILPFGDKPIRVLIRLAT